MPSIGAEVLIKIRSESISVEVLDAVQNARQGLSTSHALFAVVRRSVEHVEEILWWLTLYELGDRMSGDCRRALRRMLARDMQTILRHT